MAISTFIPFNSHNKSLVAAALNVDATITTDQVIKLNTNGRKFCRTAATQNVEFLNPTGTSISTVTNGSTYSGASRTGTQISPAASLSGTAYRTANQTPSSDMNVMKTFTTMYFSCTATTATAGAKFNIYYYFYVAPL